MDSPRGSPAATVPPPLGDQAGGVEREYDAAFNAFFRQKYRATVRAVMYAGASLEDAEDVVASAMTEVYVRWPLVENHAAWTRTVAIHEYMSTAQRDRIRPRLEEAATRRDGSEISTAEPAEAPDERTRVLAALRTLPPAQQAVMALALDGYEPMAIAGILRVPPANVRSNLRHARDKLRQSFEGAGTER